MSDSSPLDLAKLDAWHGVRPGMTRAQVLAAMQQQGVEAEAYGQDNLTATTNDWEMEFHFATDGSERLRQLSIESGGIVWAGRPLMGAPVDAALRTMEPVGSAVWEANDVIGEPFPEPDEEPAEPVSDEELLEEGTIWLPERGLGLVICEGQVIGVAWRAAQDLPARFAGPVTDAQRQLSLRPDIESHLREKGTERFKLDQAKEPMRWPRSILTLTAIIALVLIGRAGFDEMRRWNQAPTLTGNLVAIERAPMRQFRDFLPPALKWIIPAQRPVEVEVYRVKFMDAREQWHEAVLERGELYVPPQEIGEEVPVVYVEGDPPRVSGLSRARDSAFIEYLPLAIAVGAIYLATQFLLSLLSRLPRLLRRFLPKGSPADLDRPDLR